MARNTKPGKKSDVTKKLEKEQEATDKAQSEREAEMKAAEEAKLEVAKEESDNQTPPVAVPVPLKDKERKAAWDALEKEYAEKNPVKYAVKKKAGHFEEIPSYFTGRNELDIKE